MNKYLQCGDIHRRIRPCLKVACLGWAFALCAAGCGSHKQVTIAVIPQTEGIVLWDTAHAGADDAASQTGASIYWNAPTREDDVEAQISLVDHVLNGNYQGMVLAPDQALALISPVRRVLARGIPTVIIGSPLPIPAGGNLSYICNDDEEGGRLAAQRVGEMLQGHGTVAVLGINPDVTGIMIRARAFEQSLAQNYPGIQIVEKRMGSFNVPREQQVAQDVLKAHRDLDVIVALMWSTVDGALSALDTVPESHPVKVIGFDTGGWPPFAQKTNLDSVIQEDTRAMGQQAIELIHARLQGHSVPAQVILQPKLITRDNVNTAEVRRMFSLDWQFGHWHWSLIQ
jgi:ribose transport system substrate-binding protein